MYLICGLRQLFSFQCSPEMPKGWTPPQVQGYQFNFRLGHKPGLQVQSLVGARTDWCFSPTSVFLSLSFSSLPLSIKINKYIFLNKRASSKSSHHNFSFFLLAFLSIASIWEDGCWLNLLWSSFLNICKSNYHAVQLTYTVMYANYFSIKLKKSWDKDIYCIHYMFHILFHKLHW